MKVVTLSVISFSFLVAACGEPPLGPTSNQVTTTQSQTELGSKIFQDRSCINCHSITSTGGRAPGLGGLFGSEIELSDGTKIIADESYIRESIANPKAKVRAGFEGARMPAYKLTEEEMTAVIAYIKSLPQ